MESRPPTSCGSWTAPGFSPELVLRALAVVAHKEESLISVMDWFSRRFVYIQGSPQLLFGISLEAFSSDPSAWQRSLSDYDRATLVGLREELTAQRVAVRNVQATGGDGVVRSLRIEARLVEMCGQTLLCGSAAPAGKSRTEVAATNPMRDAVEQAREGLGVTDAAGNFVYLNQEHVAMFGYGSAAEMIGKSWRILYTPEGLRQIEEEVFPELVARKNWTGQLLAKRKDGSLMHESLSLSLLPGGGLVCNCRDISEQVAVADRLRQSEELFRAFLNALPIGVIIRKMNGAFEFLNDATKQWFTLAGMPQIQTEALVKRLVDDPVFGGSSSADKQVAATGESLIFDYPFSCGERTWILQVEKMPLREAGNEESHVCTLVRDVTEQRRLEKQAGAMLRRSEEYREMQVEFISMVSHEFRTPLTSIQGVHYLLGKKAERLPSAQGDEFERLLSLQGQALANLKELVDQVLLLNRLEHAEIVDVLPPVNVAQFFVDLVEGLNISVAGGRIRLEINLPASYEAQLFPAKIRAASENLISNALKYSPEDSDVRVKVELADKGWRIAVTDCGRGIPAADQAKLFQAFHRASNVGGVPGTGLGLAIVRRVADLHGGTVAFSSTEGAGSEFTLIFPKEQSPSAAPVLPSEKTRPLNL